MADIRNIANFERSMEAAAAEKIILEGLQKFSAQHTCAFHHYRKKTTDVVYAVDGDGNEVAYGLGKGIFSKVGAYGECLEHFLYKDIGRKEFVAFSLGAFKRSEAYQHDVILQYAARLGGTPETLDCIEFTSVLHNRRMFVPRFFINHHYLNAPDSKGDFARFIGRYVTTSGAAFALTEDDAYLHALTESLERDVTSAFFLAIAGQKHAGTARFYKLNMGRLPEYLMEQVRYVREGYRPAAIELYIAKTVFETWWSICIIKFPDDAMIVLPQFGAGCSLSYDLAMYRSLCECVQMLDNYEEENRASDVKLRAFVEKFPRFNKIAYLDTQNMFPEQAYNVENNIDAVPVRRQIERIASAMIARGFVPWKHVAHDTHGFYLVCAYTPNLERFYNITKSMPVLPMTYIRELLAAS